MKPKKPPVLRLADAPAATAAHWTVADMLRETLADIESGRVVAKMGCIVISGEIDGASDRLMTRAAGTTAPYQVTGLLAEALNARCGE